MHENKRTFHVFYFAFRIVYTNFARVMYIVWEYGQQL